MVCRPDLERLVAPDPDRPAPLVAEADLAEDLPDELDGPGLGQALEVVRVLGRGAVPAGVYFVRLAAGGELDVRKLVRR